MLFVKIRVVLEVIEIGKVFGRIGRTADLLLVEADHHRLLFLVELGRTGPHSFRGSGHQEGLLCQGFVSEESFVVGIVKCRSVGLGRSILHRVQTRLVVLNAKPIDNLVILDIRIQGEVNVKIKIRRQLIVGNVTSTVTGVGGLDHHITGINGVICAGTKNQGRSDQCEFYFFIHIQIPLRS